MQSYLIKLKESISQEKPQGYGYDLNRNINIISIYDQLNDKLKEFILIGRNSSLIKYKNEYFLKKETIKEGKTENREDFFISEELLKAFKTCEAENRKQQNSLLLTINQKDQLYQQFKSNIVQAKIAVDNMPNSDLKNSLKKSIQQGEEDLIQKYDPYFSQQDTLEESGGLPSSKLSDYVEKKVEFFQQVLKELAIPNIQKFMDSDAVKKFKNIEGKTFEDCTLDEINDLYPDSEIAYSEHFDIKNYGKALNDTLTCLSDLEDRIKDNPRGAISSSDLLKKKLDYLVNLEKEAVTSAVSFGEPSVQEHINMLGYSPLIKQLVADLSRFI